MRGAFRSPARSFPINAREGKEKESAMPGEREIGRRAGDKLREKEDKKEESGKGRWEKESVDREAARRVHQVCATRARARSIKRRGVTRGFGGLGRVK